MRKFTCETEFHQYRLRKETLVQNVIGQHSTRSSSQAQVENYRERGILHPLPALSSAEAGDLYAHYRAHADFIKGRNNHKPHLLFTWLDSLVRDPRIVNSVESLLGPNLWCWSSQFFAKPAGDAAYVSWHQDATYWGLSSPDVVTAWVALTSSTRESGCMQAVAGTHHAQVHHEDRFDDANLLSRRQEVAVKVDPAQVIDVELLPGEMSLHHVLLFHGSEPNRSAQARMKRPQRSLRSLPPEGALSALGAAVRALDGIPCAGS